MANSQSQKTWVLDTAGIISLTPVVIEKIIWYPNATGNSVKFSCWSESDTAAATKTNQTVTATASTRTFSSTANFAADASDVGKVIKIIGSSSKNAGTYLIASNADANTITADAAQTVEDDTTKVYSWKTWTPWEFVTLRGSGVTDDKSAVEMDFDGYWVPNLIMDDLAASGKVLILLS